MCQVFWMSQIDELTDQIKMFYLCKMFFFFFFCCIRWFHWCRRRRQLSRSDLWKWTSPLHIQLLLQSRNQQWPVCIHRPVTMPSVDSVRSPNNNRPGFCSQQCQHGAPATPKLTDEPCSTSVWQCSIPEPYGASHSSPHLNDPASSPDAAAES